MKVAIATPSRGLVHSRTTEAVMANLAGHSVTGWFLSHDKAIPECAEYVAEQGLASGADVVWFVEEDVIPPSGALAASLRLLAQGNAVVAVDYPVAQGTGCLSRNPDGSIAWVGLGATLVSRAAFEAVAKPWFRTTRGYGGHDIHFCREIMAKGLHIGVVEGMIAGHARLEERGRQGSNVGAHRVTVLDRIDKPYTENVSPVIRTALDPAGTVVLVPRRGDGGERDRLWAHCRAWWERSFDVPIFEGVHEAKEGPFSRAIALNRAATLAGDWAVAIIADADTLPDPVLLVEATTRAHLSGQMVLPFTDRRLLTPEETERVLHGEPPVPGMGNSWPTSTSGIVVVSRRLWDMVGGFDEQFVGWGAEDDDFADACLRTGGQIVKLPGVHWHLHHARPADAVDKSRVYQANRQRWLERRRQWQDLPTLYRKHRKPIVPDEHGPIPPVLHRVAIGIEPADSRRWWARFAELHPSWELRTHSLPFDREAWPLTSWLWPHTIHPAQLADFIRLEALWNDGGVYVDWDVEPVRAFDTLLPLEGFVGWAHETIANNAVMGFRPHHPAVAAALELAIERFMKDRNNLVSIGPGAITEATKGRSDVLMLPPQSFFSAGNNSDPRQREGQFADPWVYVVHWNHGTWKKDHPWRPEHEGRNGAAERARARRAERLARRAPSLHTVVMEPESITARRRRAS